MDYKEKVIERLNLVIACIKNGEGKDLQNLLAHSPAGDGYGLSNYYIDLSDIDADLNDLSDVAGRLIDDKNMADKIKMEQENFARSENLSKRIFAMRIDEFIMDLQNEDMIKLYMDAFNDCKKEGKRNKFKKIRNRLSLTQDQFVDLLINNRQYLLDGLAAIKTNLI